MDVVVFAKHAEVDPDLRRLTNEKLGRIAKYANDVRRVDVDYAQSVTRRADDSHTCEILVHLSHHLVKGRASARYREIAPIGTPSRSSGAASMLRQPPLLAVTTVSA